MALTPYCQNVLKAELLKADYNGMTQDQAYAWLTAPRQETTQRPAGTLLTPVIVARLLGPVKAEAVAAALKQTFPTIADHLLTVGVDPTNAAVQSFIGGLVTAGTLTQTDAQALGSTAVESTTSNLPPRLYDRFRPDVWPSVVQNPGQSDDGTVDAGGTSPAIHGFPNEIGRDDFNTAWAAAGRS